MGIEALKQQLAEGKLTKEQFAAEVKKLLDAGTITQEEHDAAVKEDQQQSPGGQAGGLTEDQVKAMIAAAVQSETDRVRTEWKAKVDAKDAELRAKMTDEEKARLDADNLKKDLEDRERKLNEREVALHTVDKLTDAKLPLSFKAFLAASTKEDTDKNIADFQTAWQEAIKAAVDERFKNAGGDPPGGQGGNKGEKNPWSKEHFNLTEQGKIFKADPEKARKLAATAGIKL